VGLLIPMMPVAERFLCGAIVTVNAYWHTKLQLSGSISFEDMEGGLGIKNTLGANDTPKPLSGHVLYK